MRWRDTGKGSQVSYSLLQQKDLLCLFVRVTYSTVQSELAITKKFGKRSIIPYCESFPYCESPLFVHGNRSAQKSALFDTIKESLIASTDCKKTDERDVLMPRMP